MSIKHPYAAVSAAYLCASKASSYIHVRSVAIADLFLASTPASPIVRELLELGAVSTAAEFCPCERE